MATEHQKQELIHRVSALVDQKFHGDYRRAFQHYARHDGKIDEHALASLLKDANVGNRWTRNRWVSGTIEALDRDGDGSISWTEFETVLSKGLAK